MRECERDQRELSAIKGIKVYKESHDYIPRMIPLFGNPGTTAAGFPAGKVEFQRAENVVVSQRRGMRCTTTRCTPVYLYGLMSKHQTFCDGIP